MSPIGDSSGLGKTGASTATATGTAAGFGGVLAGIAGGPATGADSVDGEDLGWGVRSIVLVIEEVSGVRVSSFSTGFS